MEIKIRKRKVRRNQKPLKIKVKKVQRNQKAMKNNKKMALLRMKHPRKQLKIL